MKASAIHRNNRGPSLVPTEHTMGGALPNSAQDVQELGAHCNSADKAQGSMDAMVREEHASTLECCLTALLQLAMMQDVASCALSDITQASRDKPLQVERSAMLAKLLVYSHHPNKMVSSYAALYRGELSRHPITQPTAHPQPL